MKNIIIYTRVSTDEQAENGYSLPAQEEKLMKYCESRGFNIVKAFKEDYSAWKGFDRPAYNQLSKYLRENKGKVDMILFTQWSRFSRDITESYNEIKRLRDMNIEPNAIEQMIDFNIPENLYLLAMYLAAPQVENDRLSDRTKVGMNQALKQGKWLWKGPYGYKNMQEVIDAKTINKYLDIVPDEAQHVRSAFELMETGLYSAEEVRRTMKEKGLTLTKQAFLNMLQNVFYTGKILIKAFKDEPEQIVNGQHQSLISDETFQNVQLILKGKKKSYKGITKNEATPLVGRLYCPNCNRPMTGSGSRGNGGTYHYYHCQRKYGCKNAIAANVANKHFDDYLTQFQAKPETLELFQAILNDTFTSSGIDREIEKGKLKIGITQIDDRLEKAAMKNLDGIWDDETFLKSKQRLESQKNELMVRLQGLNMMAPQFDTYLGNSIQLLSNLGSFYSDCDSPTRKKLIGSIFPEKIYFENNEYRTTELNEVIELLFSLDKGSNENSLANNARLSSVAPPVGLEPTTL
ncbi:MAG: recombinase family protein [Chitinophagaceae bacterium]|nr:recombinase family protein [Chitinophagaceae bacterium]